MNNDKYTQRCRAVITLHRLRSLGGSFVYLKKTAKKVYEETQFMSADAILRQAVSEFTDSSWLTDAYSEHYIKNGFFFDDEAIDVFSYHPEEEQISEAEELRQRVVVYKMVHSVKCLPVEAEDFSCRYSQAFWDKKVKEVIEKEHEASGVGDLGFEKK
ncbi:MAG: hypothetical protein J6K39_00320 [Clostridia bacterium]|nr:hypothetical protein [Clostridia bacterium]